MPEKEGEILLELIVLLSTLSLCTLLKSIFRCSADWRYVGWGLSSMAAAWAVALVHFWLCWGKCAKKGQRVLRKLFETAFTVFECGGGVLVVWGLIRLVF